MNYTLKGTTDSLKNENGETSKNSFSRFNPSNLFSRFSRKKHEESADDSSTNVTGKNTSLRKLNETLRDILELLKTNIQDDKDRFALERTFQEEKDHEDERKHQEFLTVLGEFAQYKGFVIEEKKEEKSGLFDIFMNIFNKLKDMLKAFGVRILKLSRFIFNTSRLILRIFGWPALIIGGLYALLRLVNKLMPDFSKIDYREAQGMLEGTDVQIEDYLKRYSNALPPEYMNRQGLTGRQKIEAFVNDQKASRLATLKGKEQSGTLTPEEKDELRKLELSPRAPVTTPTQLPNAPARPATPPGRNPNIRTEAQVNWDNRYGRTHNPDGTPKVQTTAQPLVNVTPSTVGAGRDGTAEITDYLARKEEERIRQSGTGGASFGPFPSSGKRTPKPAPEQRPPVTMPTPAIPPTTMPTPATAIETPEPNSFYFNNIMRDNFDLNLREMYSDMLEEPKTVVSNNNSSRSNIGPTLGPEAAQRDDTYTLNVVLGRYKKSYV